MSAIVILLLGASLFFARRVKKRFGFTAPVVFFLIVSILCECVCFNFESLRSTSYKPIEDYTLTSSAPEDNGSYVFDSSGDYIHLEIPQRTVENIHIKTDSIYHELYFYASDESSQSRYYAGGRSISSESEATNYIRINLSGKANQIRIYVPDATEENPVTLSEIDLNCPVPFSFSLLRVFLCFIILLFIHYLLISKELWNIPYKPDSSKQKTTTVTVALVIAALFLIIPFTNPSFIDPRWPHHNQYNELADSFLSGQLYLEREVPQELLEMENPYDTAQRAKVFSAAGKTQPWDVSYYDGHYYVYFGVLPELLFYVPAHMLGTTFPNFMGVVIFSWVLIAGVFLLMSEFIKRYVKSIPYLLYLVLASATLLSGGIMYMIKRPDFYSIPIMGALAFTVMGFYFWLSSIGEDGKLNHSRLLIGSLFMACVLMLRPNLVFYSCGAFLIFWRSVFTDREMLSVNSRLLPDKFRGIKNTLYFCAPYIIVGLFVMWYNAARFSSPFDFGAAYNLTTSDMTHRGFSMDRFDLGLFEYLFRPPTISSEFPFIQGIYPDTSYIGYTSRESMYGGIFITCPLLWALMAMYKIKETKPFKFAVFLSIASFITCLLDIQAGGILPRYTSDFALFFVLVAVITLLLLHEHRPFFTVKFATLALFAIIIYDILIIIGTGTITPEDLKETLYSSPFADLVFFM